MGRFRVLCVCTGNICRSPAAERLLGARLGPTVDVSSAGLAANPGRPVAPRMAELLVGAGVDPVGFSSRRLTERLLIRDEQPDLVVTMTQVQRGEVAELWPRGTRQTFTLAELARLLAGPTTPPAALDTTVAQRLTTGVAWAARNRRPPADSGSDDIADPYGQDEDAYMTAYRAVAAAVDDILHWVEPGAERADSQQSLGVWR